MFDEEAGALGDGFGLVIGVKFVHKQADELLSPLCGDSGPAMAGCASISDISIATVAQVFSGCRVVSDCTRTARKMYRHDSAPDRKTRADGIAQAGPGMDPSKAIDPVPQLGSYDGLSRR